MAKILIEYSPVRVNSPLTFWVHHKKEPQISPDSKVVNPPLPDPIPGKGYAVYKITYRNHDLHFSSIHEIEHCISILSQRVLPTTLQLATSAGYPDYQHLHWLSKWPSDIKNQKHRQQIIKLLNSLKQKI